MPVLQVVSSKPLAGKTAIAIGLGQGLAKAGSPVRLLRAGSGEAALQDAYTFAGLLFASSPGRPVTDDEAAATRSSEISVIEHEAGTERLSPQAAVLVVRAEPDEADVGLAGALGGHLLGTIATRVPGNRIEDIARALTNQGMRPLAVLPENHALAAPSVAEIRQALGADLLYEAENTNEVVEDVVIGPVFADPARPHFSRFASKAVLAPFNKTDLLLVAIETQAACLVITGGRQPSPYVVDRAQGEETTVLLAPKETPETVASLAEVWLTSRFRGARKAEAISALMEGRIDFPDLLRKLS